MIKRTAALSRKKEKRKQTSASRARAKESRLFAPGRLQITLSL
jgi:hypothetical protein